MKPYNFLFSAICLASAPTFAGTIDESIQGQMDHLEKFYRDLHQNPELSMKETRTVQKLKEEFQALGLETFEIGGGVVGILRNGEGPTTLVRSELDGLPVQEESGVPYKSQVPGVMHACAHDLHTTAIVGTAKTMIEQKANWKGNLVFVGQPGEETVKGAKSMIDAGLLKKIPKLNQAVALHTYGAAAPGTVGFSAGPVLAAADSVDVIIRGKGTHGASPHKGIDPIIIASEFVLKMQSLIGREVDPIEPAVISVGSIHGGTKHNIISEEVKLQLTVRTYFTDTRDKLIKRIEEIAKSLSQAAGAPAPTVAVVESTPVTVNEPILTARFRDAAIKAVGEANVHTVKQVLAGEDFGHFGKAAGVPSVFFRLGAQMKNAPDVINHSPKFAPDLRSTLPVGIKVMAAGLLDLHGANVELYQRVQKAEKIKPSAAAAKSGTKSSLKN